MKKYKIIKNMTIYTSRGPRNKGEVFDEDVFIEDTNKLLALLKSGYIKIVNSKKKPKIEEANQPREVEDIEIEEVNISHEVEDPKK